MSAERASSQKDLERIDALLAESLTDEERDGAEPLRAALADLAGAAKAPTPAPTGPLAALLSGGTGADLAAARAKRRRGFTAGFVALALGAAGVAGAAATPEDAAPKPLERQLVVQAKPTAEVSIPEMPLVEASAPAESTTSAEDVDPSSQASGTAAGAESQSDPQAESSPAAAPTTVMPSPNPTSTTSFSVSSSPKTNDAPGDRTPKQRKAKKATLSESKPSKKASKKNSTPKDKQAKTKKS